MAEAKKNNRFNNIIKDLKSGDTKKIVTAISQLRKHGKPEAIPVVLDVLVASKDTSIHQEIKSFLFDLKSDSAVSPLIEAIGNSKYADYKNILISVFWESSLNAGNHLDFFIKQAINGDYITCVEVLTIIENLDSTFPEDEIEDLKYDLSEAIEMEDSDKNQLLTAIRSVLDSLKSDY